MPKFALKYPYFVIMLCLMVMLVGVVNVFSVRSIFFQDGYSCSRGCDLLQWHAATADRGGYHEYV